MALPSWPRLLCCLMVALLFNSYAGGHQLAAAWATARDIREHNAEILARLKLPEAPTEGEIRARKAAARAQIAETRAADRARQAAGLRELEDASAIAWMAQDDANLGAVSAGIRDLAALTEGILRSAEDASLIAQGTALGATAETTLALAERLTQRGALADTHFARLQAALAPLSLLPPRPTPEETRAAALALDGALRAQVEAATEAARARFGASGSTGRAPRAEARDPRTGILTHPGAQPFVWDVEGVQPQPPALSASALRARFPGAPSLRVGPPEAARLDAPEDADLLETVDAPLSDAIRAKAAELGGDPRALYRFVADEVDYGIYAGSVHGAQGTLDTGYGNDVDQASLLIALLRASDIPARYEVGTVDMSAGQVAATTGISDLYSAYQTFANQGVPSILITSGGAYTALRLERTWVSAFVPYTDYRGVDEGRGGGEGQWIRLDPALMDYDVVQRFDVAQSVPFDADAFLSAPPSLSPMAFYDDALRDHLAETGTRCENLEDLVARRVHTPSSLDIVPHSLPYAIVGETARLPALTSAQRLTIEVELVSAWGISLMAAEVEAVAAYGETLALTFPSGAGVASSVSGSVKPTLSLGGEILKQLGGTSVGVSYALYVTARVPGGKAPTKRHLAVAGGTYAINVHTGPVASRLVFEAEAAFRSLIESGASQPRMELALAHLAGLRFAAQGYEDAMRAFALHRWIPFNIRESVTGTNLIPTSMFGFPIGAAYGGMFIDAQSFFFAMPMEGRREEARQGEIAKLFGYNGSYLEHRIWEEVTGVEFASSTNILQWARQAGQRIFHLTSLEDYATVAEQLSHSGAVLGDVERALEQGFEVILSEGPVTRGDATASGYILRDPVSGAGSFLISGGLGGGLQTIYTWILEVVRAVYDFLTCNYPVASEVDVGTGCLSDAASQMGIFAYGAQRPLTFHYQSGQDLPSDLGQGWAWTFGARLFPDAETGVVTLLYDDAFYGDFTPKEGGGYSPPEDQRDVLEALGEGWRVTLEDRRVWTFDTEGLLLSETDAIGNVLTLTRDGDGHVTGLKDDAGRILLTLQTDDAGHITQVEDAAARTLALTYVAGQLAALQDVRGERWTYGYDGQGRLIRRVDPASEAITYGYDAEGRLARYTTPSGGDGFVAYDALNRRSVLEDATGAERLFDLDEDGDLQAFIDPVGNKTTYTWEDGELTGLYDPRGGGLTRVYDDEGKLLSSVDSLGVEIQLTYDDDGRPTSLTQGGETTTMTWHSGGDHGLTMANAGGQTASFETDAQGKMTAVDPGDGTSLTLTWDADGTLASTTDGEGHTTDYEMDAAGRVLSVDAPDTGTWTFAWDGRDQMVGLETPAGVAYAMTWSPHGQLQTLTHPTGVVETWTYDGPWLLAHTDAQGGVTRYLRDAEGRALGVIEPSGARVEVRRDAAGRIASLTDRYGNETELGYCGELGGTPCDVIDPRGHLTQRLFDDAGRLLSQSDDRGSDAYEYDDIGRLVAYVDRLGHRTEYGWGPQGQLTSVLDALGQTSTYTWEGGRLASVTDPSQATTTYLRDARGRLAQVIDPLDRVTHYTWDARGLPATRLAPGGATTTWQHDGAGHVTAEVFDDGTEHTYTYDAEGRRTRAVGPAGDVEYLYEDPLGRPTSVIDHVTGHRIDVVWEAVTGRIGRVTRPDGTYRYQYNVQGDLVGITLPSGARVTQRFDPFGRLIERRFPNGVVETKVWDTYGRLAGKLTYGPDGRILLGWSYTYDAMDRRASETDARGRVTSYAYDPLGRLIDVEDPEGTTHYTFDEAGNRIEETRDGAIVAQYTYDASHRLLSRTLGGVETTYAYDDRGRCIGRTTGGETTTYAFDGAGRLTGVEAPGEDPIAYGYDADSRRTLTETQGGATLTTWEDFHPVAQSGPEGDKAFVYGQGIDQALGVTDTTAGETTWLHTDALGSVVGQTGGEGALTGRFGYEAYGAPTEGEAPEDLAFAGRPFEATTGLVDMRARSYDPEDGRFLQPDPITPVSFEMKRTGAPAAMSGLLGANLLQLLASPQRLNPYAYVAGDPINGSDPSGEMLRHECLGIWVALNIALAVFLLILGSFTGFGAVVFAAQIALAILDHLRGNSGSFGPPTWGDALNVVGLGLGPVVKGLNGAGPLAQNFGNVERITKNSADLIEFLGGQALKYIGLGTGIAGVAGAKADHEAAVQEQQNLDNNLVMMNRA